MKKTLKAMTLAALTASAGMLASASPAQAQPLPAGGDPPAQPAPAPAPNAPPAPPALPGAAPAAPPANPAPAQPAPAQPAPPPPHSAEPAPASPPAADFGVAPAALPAAPVGASAPVPAVSWGAPGADADTTTPAPAGVQKPPSGKLAEPVGENQNPFYFTRFTWGNTASTSLFGVGQPIQGHDGDTYNMSFALNFRYYFVNKPLDKAYVNANVGFAVEVTDTTSTTTTTQHEPVMNDTVIGLGYGHTVYRSLDKQWSTTPIISASMLLPTSKPSYSTGKYLGVGVNAAMVQAIPLAGKSSDWFSDLLAFGVVGYYHQFSRCYIPCNNSAAPYPRQIAGAANAADAVGGGGATITLPDSFQEDQLAGSGFAIDKARFNVTYFLSIYKDLSFANSWDLLMPFKHQFPETTVATSTGGVPVGSSFTMVNPVTTFDVSLSYLLFDTARIDLGYQNITPELVDHVGYRNSVFYSVGGAVFYGNATLYIDNLLDKAMHPPDKEKKLAEGRFHVMR